MCTYIQSSRESKMHIITSFGLKLKITWMDEFQFVSKNSTNKNISQKKNEQIQRLLIIRVRDGGRVEES